MSDRVREHVPDLLRLLPAALLILALYAPGAAAQPPPTAHHPGVWTTAAPWPPRTSANSVWAVHMALTRGDTLFARPHSRVLAFGRSNRAVNGRSQRSGNSRHGVVVESRTRRPPSVKEKRLNNAFLPRGGLLVGYPS